MNRGVIPAAMWLGGACLIGCGGEHGPVFEVLQGDIVYQGQLEKNRLSDHIDLVSTTTVTLTVYDCKHDTCVDFQIKGRFKIEGNLIEKPVGASARVSTYTDRELSFAVEIEDREIRFFGTFLGGNELWVEAVTDGFLGIDIDLGDMSLFRVEPEILKSG